MTRARTIATAGLALYVNGERCGRVMSFQWDVAVPRKAIKTIDQLDPVELAPTETRVRGSVGIVRTLGDGGAEGQGFVATFPDIPRERYFSLMLIERLSGRVVFRADRCSLVEQSWTAAAKSIVTGNISFEAIDYSNEVGQFS